MSATLPDGVLIAFYGDDFTGSTDAMEVSARAGLATVLFTNVPDAGQRARFDAYRVVGIAGTARAHGPAWMDENLPAPLRFLASLRATVLQYKVCSTFDSSPRTGSIGHAIEIGMSITGSAWSPVIVGVPQLRRWLAFGNLFAAMGEECFRIDRHPTMSRHPVTPMDEADLLRHLSRQTTRRVRGIDLCQLRAGDGDRAVQAARDDRAIAIIDVLDDHTQAQAGRLVWEHAGAGVFSASSSGLQYALLAHWRAVGALPPQSPPMAPASRADRLLVLSGSCSAMTAVQLQHAEAHGFAAIRLDVISLLTEAGMRTELTRVLDRVRSGFDAAPGVLVYAARTVDDEAFVRLRAQCQAQGLDFAAAQARIGSALGELARVAVTGAGLKRLVVAGGDTSGRVVSALPIFALEMLAPLATGSPLCRCHSDDAAFDGLELVLKGGQVGGADLFVRALVGADQGEAARVR